VRKLLPILFISLTVAFSAMGQEQEQALDLQDKKVISRLGFQLGYAHYTLNGKEVDLRTNRGAELQGRIGTHIGGVYQLELFKFFYLKTGLTYLKKGGELVGGGWVHKGPVKVNYLNIPLLAGITPFRTKELRISFEGGAAYNLLMGSEIPYTRDIVENYYTREETSIASLLWGIEAAYLLSGNKRFFINYRNSRDTKYFHARIYRPTGLTYDLNNQGYSLTAGLLYTLNK
jgi:hypothetical protein